MATEEEFDLIEKRLEAWNEKFVIASMQLGNFTKEEALKHIKARDEIGQKLVEIQLYYLNKLKER
jgi:hypothetical protein